MSEGLSLLLLEDDVSLSQALQQFLTLDYEATAVDSVMRARNLARERSWDVALLDLHLPDGSSLDLIPLLKAKNPRCAVLVFSGQAELGNAKKALTAGADDYIVKSPHLIQELFVRIPKARERVELLSAAAERLPRRLEELSAEHYHEFLRSAERDYLTAALRLCQDAAPEVGHRIGLGRSTVFKKLNELGVRAKP